MAATSEGILIEIAAKVDNAVSGVKQVKEELLNVGEAGKATAHVLDDSLNKMEAAFNAKWSPVVAKAEKSIISLKNQVTAFGGGVAAFKTPDYFAKVGSEAEKGFKKVTESSQNARYAVLDIGHIFRDLPYAIANPAILAGPFDRATQALTTLKQTSSATGQGMTELVKGALTGGGGLLIAIELITSALIIFGPKLIEAFKGGSTAMSEMVENLHLLNEVNKEANKNAAGQITDLKILYTVATDVNASMKDRLSAVKTLKQEFPDYFKQIANETILNGNARSSYDALTNSILKSARAAAAKDKIKDLESQKLDIVDANTKIENAANAESLRADNVYYTDALGQRQLFYNKRQNLHFIAARKLAAEEANNAKYSALEARQSFLAGLVGTDEIAKTITDNTTFDKAKKPKKEKKTDAEKESDILERLSKAKAAIDIEEAATGKALDPQRISVIESAIKDLLNIKVSATSKTIKDLSDEIRSLSQPTFKKVSVFTEKEPGDAINPFPDTIKTGPLHILDQIIQKQEEAKKSAQDYNKSINDIGKSLVGTFENVFTELIDGGGNALKVFGKFIQAVIMKLIAAAAVAAILTAVTGGAFGGGAVTGGTNFLSRFSAIGGLPFHAAGGMTTGPHVALVGDNPSGKEAIIPFERMGEFMNNFGGGGQDMTIRHEIDGDKLVLVIDRTRARQGRVG